MRACLGVGVAAYPFGACEGGHNPIAAIPPTPAFVRLEADTYAVSVGEPATFRAVVTTDSGQPVPGASVKWSTFYWIRSREGVSAVWVQSLDPPVTTTSASGRASVAYEAPLSGRWQRLVARLDNGAADTAAIVASVSAPTMAGSAWSDLPPMPYSRASMAAVAHGGRIFILGGFCQAYLLSYCGPFVALNSVRVPGMVFTPATGQWEQFAVPDSLRLTNRGYALVDPPAFVLLGADLSDGIHLIAAGRHLLYEPESARWSARLPAWPDSLPRPALAQVVQGRLHVVSDAGALRIYDAFGDRWSDGATMPRAPGTPGRDGPVSGVLDDQIYVAGGGGFFDEGRELTRYDPAADAWSALPPMPYGRSDMAAGVLAGRFCVFGGGEADFRGSELFLETYCYDPRLRAWLLGPPRALYNIGMAAVPLGNAVYVFGGASLPYKQGWITGTAVSLLARR